MRFTPRTALGFGLLTDLVPDVPRTKAGMIARIQRQLAALDARPADGMDEKDAVRKKLLARLREVERNP